jgi:hypothetical protein
MRRAQRRIELHRDVARRALLADEGEFCAQPFARTIGA